MNELSSNSRHARRPLSVSYPSGSLSYPLEPTVFVHSSGHSYKWLYFRSASPSVLNSFALKETKKRCIKISLVFQEHTTFQEFLTEKGFILKWNSSSTMRCSSKNKEDLKALFQYIVQHNEIPSDFKQMLSDAVENNPADTFSMNEGKCFTSGNLSLPYPERPVEFQRSIGDWSYISQGVLKRVMDFTAIWPSSCALQSFNIYSYSDGTFSLRVEITEYDWGKALRDYLQRHGFAIIRDSFAKMGTVYVNTRDRKHALFLFQIISCNNYFMKEDLRKLNQIFGVGVDETNRAETHTVFYR